MDYWQILIVAGVIFLIIEIFTPMVFFLNFAIACFITAVIALFIIDLNYLIPIFIVFSAIFLIFLRPILVKSRDGGKKTGVEEKYIGKTAKVIETVTSNSGVVSIYDERWNARSDSDEEIPAGEEATIVRNESLVLYVKR
ncbi:MAG TPA: NfeD family protein [Candidatus Gastranaerophilaceae bacterium]|nr:NfeD family protein [Candidatus Gastranaerophilaceae bacterium]